MQISLLKRPAGRLLYLYAAIAGAIYPVGLAPLSLWPVLLFSIFVLLHLCILARNEQIKWVCYWYGVGFFAVGASWVHVSIHEFGHAPLVLSVFLTLAFVLFLALFKWLMGILLVWARRRYGSIGLLFCFPIAWMLIDGLQAVFLTGFPWLYLGYGLVESLFAGWLKWFGVSGASYLAVVLVAVSYYLLQQRKHSSGPAVLLALIAWGSFIGLAYLAANTETESTKTNYSIALIQPNIPQAEKWKRENLREYLERYDSMTEPFWGSDLIIWPEAAIPSLKHRVDNWLSMWNEKAKSSGSQLILGIPIYEFEQQNIYASVISLGAVETRYDKQHLVPFGEFVPLEDWIRGLIEFFNLPMSGMSPGSAEQTALELDSVNLYPAICYEIAYASLFDRLIRSTENNKPGLIVTISNDAWFGRSWGPHQHFQIARARAIEFGMPVIRSTNTGITAVIDRNGKVLKQLPQFEQDVLAGQFSLVSGATLYSQYSWLMLLLLVLAVQCLLFGLFQYFNRRDDKSAADEN